MKKLRSYHSTVRPGFPEKKCRNSEQSASLSGDSVKGDMGFGVGQRKKDPARIAFLCVGEVVGGEAGERRRVDQFIKGKLVGLDQKPGRRHFLAAERVPAFFVPRSQDLFVLADARSDGHGRMGRVELAENMAAIEALDSGESLFFSHYDPKTVEWLMSIV